MKFNEMPKEFFICLKGTLGVLIPRNMEEIQHELREIDWIKNQSPNLKTLEVQELKIIKNKLQPNDPHLHLLERYSMIS